MREMDATTVKTIRKLWGEQMSIRSIAKETNVSKTTVMKYIRFVMKPIDYSVNLPLPITVKCFDCQRGTRKYEMGEYCLDLLDTNGSFRDKMNIITNGHYLNGFPDFVFLNDGVPILVIEKKAKTPLEITYIQGLWLDFFMRKGVLAYIQYEERNNQLACFSSPWPSLNADLPNDDIKITINKQIDDDIEHNPLILKPFCTYEKRWLSEKGVVPCVKRNCEFLEQREKRPPSKRGKNFKT